MSDGSSLGIGPERAIKTILGDDPAPNKEEEKSPEWWRKRLEEKDDNINGYDAHAEVIAKYMLKAIDETPELANYPVTSILQKPIDWSNPVILVPALDDILIKTHYTNPSHPFRLALSEATGFTYGWAYNIVRFVLGLPEQPNPALITIGEKES